MEQKWKKNKWKFNRVIQQYTTQDTIMYIITVNGAYTMRADGKESYWLESGPKSD